MNVLAIVHQDNARSGVFAEAATDLGHEVEEWRVASGPPKRPLGDYAAAFVFGGSMDVHEEERHPWLRDEKGLLRRLLDGGTPTLGVCLGAQLLASVAGAEVRRSGRPEIGWHEVELTSAGSADPLFRGLPATFAAFEWHLYEFALPPGAVALARNPACLQAYRLGASAWGVQFHAEVTHETALDWLTRHGHGDDAPGVSFDPARVRAETARRIEGWNDLGRGICARFLEVAARRPAPASPGSASLAPDPVTDPVSTRARKEASQAARGTRRPSA